MELEDDWKPSCFHLECLWKSCSGVKDFAFHLSIQLDRVQFHI